MKSSLIARTIATLAVATFVLPGMGNAEEIYSLTADRYVEPGPQAASRGQREKAFGVGDETAISHSALAFTPYDQSFAQIYEAATAVRYCTGLCSLISTYEVPTGAQLTGVTLDYVDADDAGNVSAFLNECTLNSTECNVLSSVVSQDDGNSTVSSSILHTVDSLNNSYIVEFLIEGGTANYGAINATVHYRRQISPAPGTATFGDVPTGHPFFQHVEALAASGITAGCGGGDYCPDAALTRGQMAVFLAKALGLHWPD